MRDLRVQEYEQLEAYTVIDLLSKAYLCYCICNTRRTTYLLLCQFIPQLQNVDVYVYFCDIIIGINSAITPKNINNKVIFH